MHEWRVTRALVNEIVRIAAAQGATRVLAAKVKISAFAGIAPDRLREQFVIAATGGIAEGASLQIEVCDESFEFPTTAVYLEDLEIEDV